MNKKEMVEKLTDQFGVSKAESGRILDSVIGLITDSLKQDGRIAVAGLGIFSVKESKPRNGRNPKTGEPLLIPAAKKVSFKASSNLVDTL